MNHLSRSELVDVVEARGRLSETRARHLDECAACRNEAAALRSVLARAANDSVPEPSPLFWDHFTARVSDAVRNQTIAADSPRWFVRVHRPLTAFAVTAAAVALATVTIVWRATLHAPTILPVPPLDTHTTLALPAASPENVDADERWAVVRAAAEDVGWDDVHDAGITAGPGEAEGVALELTADERLELARLLNQEMRRNGV